MTQSNITGTIFNTQKFSIHDGVGIRTLIFMKGCPLRCVWCSNPESQSAEQEIMDVKVNCIGCGRCAAACENAAIDSATYDIDRGKCVKCGKCTDACFANAKKKVGRQVSLQEIMHIVEKDRVFYNNSGGGITVGGGEPMLQAEFVEALLRRCQASNIHTAIETCGYGSWDKIKNVFTYTDQVFYDLKAMDSEIHKKLTGADNELILGNAAKVADMGKEIVFRIPLVAQLNDDIQNIRETGEFVRSLYEINKKISVEVLPYHDLGRDKYRWLSKEYGIAENIRSESNTLEECKETLKTFELKVI